MLLSPVKRRTFYALATPAASKHAAVPISGAAMSQWRLFCQPLLFMEIRQHSFA